MFLLRRPFLIAALIVLWATPGSAKDIPGAPKTLLGDFGRNDAACRSYHRNHDRITTFYKGENGRFYYSNCLGRQCNAEITHHRRTKDGVVLKLTFTSEFGSFDDSVSITDLGKGTFRFHFAGGKPEQFIRCRLRHAIAGIGLQPEGDGYDGDYKVWYALAVPKLCPSLEVDADRAAKRLQMETVPDVAETIVWNVEKDFDQIPGFCKEVLGAYGKNGRVIPDMLWEASDKPPR